MLSTGVAHADVAIVSVPAAAAERGIALQPGDVLREGDDPAKLDVFRLLELEAVDAARGAVHLRRFRAGAEQAIELPPGRWDLIAAPLDLAGNPILDLDAAILQTPAGDNERLAALRLARARVSASHRQFTTAVGDFDTAATLLLAREDWIAQLKTQAFENHPDRTQALHAAERAVELRRTAHAAAPLLASSLQQLAVWRSQTRDNDGARAAAEEALRLTPDTLTGASAHVVLSFVAMRTSQHDVAASELDLAEAIVARIAPDGLDRAGVLARRAVLSAVRREGDGASEAYARALPALRRLVPDSMQLGRIVFNAQLYALERRHYAEAEALAREAMAVFAAAAPDGLEYGQARAALAEVLMRRTEYAEAEALLRAAWQAATVIDARSYEALSLKLQVGDSLARQARRAEALLLFDEIELALGATDAPDAVAQTSLDADTALYRADLLSNMDRCDDAVIGASRALALYQTQHRDGAQIWDAHLVLSDCQRRLHDLSAALDHANQAIAGFRAMGAEGIQEAEAQVALARAQRDGGNTQAAIEAYTAAIDGLERHRERVGGSDEIRARWAAQFQDYYKELLWLLANNAHVGDAPGAPQLFKFEARYRAQALLQLLGEDDADLAADWAAQGSVARFAAAEMLPADTALISFVVGREGTLAIVVVPDRKSPMTMQVLPATRASLDAEVDRLLLLGARPSDNPAAIEALQAVGESLRAKLLAAIEPKVGPFKRWIIVGDGPLLRLPWSALVVQRTPQLRYLIEDHVLSVAPSAPVWAALAQRKQASDSIVAFADAGVDVGVGNAMRNLPPGGLPGARLEVDALAASFPGRVTPYFGAAATEAQVRSAAPQAGSIHFALHSVTDAREPLASHIVLATGAGLTSSDDGQLRADEIARELKLNADLIVLSSCASAVGTEAGGEGLLGLIRALHLAGTRAVIGTTWPVADRSTARLMAAFYRHRSAGLASDDALAEAQRDWLAAARDHSWQSTLARYFGIGDTLPESAMHPFYWAAFVHSGAPAR